MLNGFNNGGPNPALLKRGRNHEEGKVGGLRIAFEMPGDIVSNADHVAFGRENAAETTTMPLRCRDIVHHHLLRGGRLWPQCEEILALPILRKSGTHIIGANGTDLEEIISDTDRYHRLPFSSRIWPNKSSIRRARWRRLHGGVVCCLQSLDVHNLGVAWIEVDCPAGGIAELRQ